MNTISKWMVTLALLSGAVQVNAASGIITTVAGSGTNEVNAYYGSQGVSPTFGGDGGAATAAGLAVPQAVAVDAAGNLYIADQHNNRIRKVNTSGIISTVAGTGVRGYSGDGGLATNATLYEPSGVAVDTAGNLYIADGCDCIRKVNTSGVISTFAGNGQLGYGGDGGRATNATLFGPAGVAVDTIGNVYVVDQGNSVVREITTGGVINTIAGNGFAGFAGDGGPGTDASLNMPYGVAVDKLGNVYIADQGNSRIRKLGTNGVITTIAGRCCGFYGYGGYSGDGGPATAALLNLPLGVAVDLAGNLYIADGPNSAIRKVDTNGIITTIAGSGPTGGFGTVGFSGDGGPASTATLDYVHGVAVDTSGRGNLYIVDTNNQRVRVVTGAVFPTNVSLTDSGPGPALVSGLNVGTASANNMSAAYFSLPTQSTVTIVLKARFAIDGDCLFQVGVQTCIPLTNKTVVTLPAGDYYFTMIYGSSTASVTP